VLVEDADNTITVKAGDTQLAHKALHVNCKEEERPTTTTTLPPAPTITQAPPAQVLSETVEQPQTLAFTGRSTLVEAMAGVVLLGIGFQLMRSSRRLEQS
jgi:hypothetical protein